MADKRAPTDRPSSKQPRPVASRKGIEIPPAFLLVLLYGLLIAVGAALLLLPVSHNVPMGWSEAIFMATSAVTVTGLVVIDPGTGLTFFGQFVIATLIQLGGLGLMTFAMAVFASLGLNIGLSEKIYLQEDLGQTSVARLLELLTIIVKVVVAAVTLGTLSLACVFVPEFGWQHGLWQSLFHAISAFNNAGFSLFSNSLTDYAGNAVINVVIPLLFIVGGLGFIVLSEIMRLRRWRMFSLHTRLMLCGSAALIIVSVFLIATLEWQNPATLGAITGTGDKLMVAWFQAVTPRTAGFNTLDTAAMTDGSTLLTICLMIVGGGTTSTAGGIKVTTFVLLLLATITFFRRRNEIQAFSHSVSSDQLLKVMALVTSSLMLIIVSLFILLVTQDGEFLVLLFEAASAFGTVGLSQGATGTLDTVGRMVICVLMFTGRVGPLILGFFLATHAAPRLRYPKGAVYLG